MKGQLFRDFFTKGPYVDGGRIPKRERKRYLTDAKVASVYAREEQRAIALYNAYSFGYALGMNFRNKAGRREMLRLQDLDEITANGCNKDGCRIV